MIAKEETTKKEFFKKKSITSIRKGKEKIITNSIDLVSCIEEIDSEKQYIQLIDSPVTLLTDEGTLKYRDYVNFLKHGDKVLLKRYNSRHDAIKERLAFFKEREILFSELNPTTEYSGYGWWGIRDRRFREVKLENLLEGEKLLVFSDKSKEQENKIELLDYINVKDVKDLGGKYILRVPSRSGDFKYGVGLHSVPVGSAKEGYSNIRDLDYEHTCGSLIGDLTFKHVSKNVEFCPHIVAAYLAVARYEFRRHNKKAQELNPFALAHQQEVEFEKKLRENIIVEINDFPRRLLNFAEREKLHWDRVKIYGNSSKSAHMTFYADSRIKLQSYDWH